VCRSTLETVATSIRETLKNKFPSPFSLCCVSTFSISFLLLPRHTAAVNSNQVGKKSWKIDSSEGNRGMRVRYKVVASFLFSNNIPNLRWKVQKVRAPNGNSSCYIFVETTRRLVSIDNGDGAIGGDGLTTLIPLHSLILGWLTCVVSCLFAVIDDDQANLSSIRSTLV
jgi:hypothetical protein